MATKKAKKPEKLIDILEKALKKAGYNVVRDGWEESDDNDWCEWLEVKDDMVNNVQQAIHFYFVNNSTTLEEINIYKTEFELVEGNTERLFNFKNAAAKKAEHEAQLEKQKEQEAKKNIPAYIPFRYCC